MKNKNKIANFGSLSPDTIIDIVETTHHPRKKRIILPITLISTHEYSRVSPIFE